MNPTLELLEKQKTSTGQPRGARSKAPVFVLGCGRSGTKLLYHTLLSAGGFAIYHAESNAFNLIGLRFGNLAKRQNRRTLLDHWLRSKLFSPLRSDARRRSNRRFWKIATMPATSCAS